jgi:transcriptional regulator with XRE-family HTH domain
MRSELRRRCNLSQQKLSSLAGVPAQWISEWENGSRKLRPEQMAAIAKVLDEHLRQAPVFGGPNELARELARPSAAVAA